MSQKNVCLFRGRISERKFRDLTRLFALDITADRAAALTGLHYNTALALFRLMRLRMAEMAEVGCPPPSAILHSRLRTAWSTASRRC